MMSIFGLSFQFLRIKLRRSKIQSHIDDIWNERTELINRFSEEINQKKFYNLNSIKECARPLVIKLHSIMDRLLFNAHKLDEAIAQIEQTHCRYIFSLKKYEKKRAALSQIKQSLLNYAWLFTLVVNLKSFWQELVFPSWESLKHSGNSPFWVESRLFSLCDRLREIVEAVAISPQSDCIKQIERTLKNTMAEVVETARLSQVQQSLPEEIELVRQHINEIKKSAVPSQFFCKDFPNPIFLCYRILDLNDELKKELIQGNVRRARKLFDEILEIKNRIDLIVKNLLEMNNFVLVKELS